MSKIEIRGIFLASNQIIHMQNSKTKNQKPKTAEAQSRRVFMSFLCAFAPRGEKSNIESWINSPFQKPNISPTIPKS